MHVGASRKRSDRNFAKLLSILANLEFDSEPREDDHANGSSIIDQSVERWLMTEASVNV